MIMKSFDDCFMFCSSCEIIQTIQRVDEFVDVHALIGTLQLFNGK